MSLAKPILRGHLQAYQVKNLIVCGVLSFVVALGYKHGVAEPRKRKYAAFYKTYDAEEHERKLFEYGLVRTFKDQDN
jgi:cytochrome c oxidase subunit 6c